MKITGQYLEVPYNQSDLYKKLMAGGFKKEVIDFFYEREVARCGIENISKGSELIKDKFALLKMQQNYHDNNKESILNGKMPEISPFVKHVMAIENIKDIEEELTQIDGDYTDNRLLSDSGFSSPGLLNKITLKVKEEESVQVSFRQ